MDPERVRDRLGERGRRLQMFAGGDDPRAVTGRIPPPLLHREVSFDPALEQADQVAFGIRIAADEFIAALAQARLVCTELRVQITGDRGESYQRVWLHPEAFDAAAVVDRVRWQLAEAESLSSAPVSAVAGVRIEPEAVDDAGHHAPTLFGSQVDDRINHALTRVQSMLGHRGVLTASVGGGRWLHEREVLVPWGEPAAQPDAGPWPGSLPTPLPSTTFWPTPEITVRGPDGQPVQVTDRGRVSAEPVTMADQDGSRTVLAWAGPWPVVERDWDPARARHAYRFQLVDVDGAAWLLVYQNGGWLAEGRYD